jgi:hypothetical protein
VVECSDVWSDGDVYRLQKKVLFGCFSNDFGGFLEGTAGDSIALGGIFFVFKALNGRTLEGDCNSVS